MSKNLYNKYKMSHNKDLNQETVDHSHTEKRPYLFLVNTINKNHNRLKGILLKSRILFKMKININKNKTLKKILKKIKRIKKLKMNKNLIDRSIIKKVKIILVNHNKRLNKSKNNKSKMSKITSRMKIMKTNN